MDWNDEGFVLAARPQGESNAVVQLLTLAHGRHAGLLHGGAGRSKRALVEPGNRVQANWRARLNEHLGRYTLEPLHQYGAALLDDPLRLAALSAACTVAETALPEREPHPAMFHATQTLFDSLSAGDREVWPAVYISWELGLLGELGYGLDLAACAVTGADDDLIYVSPRTGRAVSAEAGEPYADRLLHLPRFLRPNGGTEVSAEDIPHGLRLTGFFLARHVFNPLDRPLPAARERLATLLGAADSLDKSAESRDL